MDKRITKIVSKNPDRSNTNFNIKKIVNTEFVSVPPMMSMAC